jgi:sec-independent protein translocase protein TatB
MELFGMGPTELLLVLVIAMIFLGPSKIADLGRGLGKAVNSFRKASSEFTTTVNNEMEQLKIEQGKTLNGPEVNVSESPSHLKPYTPPPTDQAPHSMPAPARSSDNIDSPGAGI